MEAVVLCGIQGAGKSTFFRERFFDTHVRISRDLLRTADRERRLLELCLQTRQPFAVDKVNATAAERRPYVAAAREHGFRTVAYWLDVTGDEALARNDRRTGKARVPASAVLGTRKRLRPPAPEEGFDAVYRVTVEPAGFTVKTFTPQIT